MGVVEVAGVPDSDEIAGESNLPQSCSGMPKQGGSEGTGELRRLGTPSPCGLVGRSTPSLGTCANPRGSMTTGAVVCPTERVTRHAAERDKPLTTAAFA